LGGGTKHKLLTAIGCWLTAKREMQLFLLGYIIISICEIFTIGGFPLNDTVRLVCRMSATVDSSI
jgi:hypothetical protein